MRKQPYEDTWGGWLMETEDGSAASTSQGAPKVATKPPKAKRKARKDFPTSFRGSMALTAP